jgi:hypothetical protein
MTLSPTKRPPAAPTDANSEGRDTSESTDLETEFANSSEERERAGNEGNVARDQRANRKKVRKAPDGSKASRTEQALERVPQIEILTEQDEIIEKNLKGRAGRYYKDAQTLFVNGLYSAVDRMVAELEPELRGQAEPEIVNAAVTKASRRLMAFRVGKATCYAISKRLSDDWSTDDLDRATSPESLSLAADDYRQNVASAKKRAKELIKAADVPKENAA